jgi:hypothetical protein
MLNRDRRPTGVAARRRERPPQIAEIKEAIDATQQTAARVIVKFEGIEEPVLAAGSPTNQLDLFRRCDGPKAKRERCLVLQQNRP